MALPRGGVANPHGAGVSESDEMRKRDLFQISIPVDGVEGLKRPRLRDVAKESQELLPLVQVAEASKCFDGECGVSEPTVAVVPRSRRCHRLGDARRRGGDDRARIATRVKLETKGRSKDGAGGERRQRTRLGPRAPSGDRQIELVRRMRQVPERLAPVPVAQDEEGRFGQDVLALGHHVRDRNARRQMDRRSSPAHDEAMRRLANGGLDAPVVGAWIEVDRDARLPVNGADDPNDLDRLAHAEPLRDTRSKVDDLPDRARVFETRGHHVRVGEVPVIAPRTSRPCEKKAKRPASFFSVEDPRAENGRRIEARLRAEPSSMALVGATRARSRPFPIAP